MSHQWTMEDFESIYSRFKSSGLSVMDFCSNECIRPKRFYEWRSKLLRKGGFIPVKVNSKGQVSLPHKEKSLLSAPPVSPSPIPQPLCEIRHMSWNIIEYFFINRFDHFHFYIISKEPFS